MALWGTGRTDVIGTTTVQRAVDHVHEAALEAAHRRPFGLALGPFLREVGLRAWLAPALAERNDMDGPI